MTELPQLSNRVRANSVGGTIDRNVALCANAIDPDRGGSIVLPSGEIGIEILK